MNGSLDDRIVDRQRSGRRDERDSGRLNDRSRPRPRMRDSYRKSFDTSRTPDDAHWVHDRFEGDRFTAPRSSQRHDRYEYEDEDFPEISARLRADNLHYDLTEKDLRELFTRKGPIKSLELLYDRADRSRGTAYVTYASIRDAERAIDAYDGQNAYGQPIKLTMMPNGPSSSGRRGGPGQARLGAGGRSLFDRVDRTNGISRSVSPRRSRFPNPAPDGVDRYVPGDRSRRRQSRSRSPLRNARREPRAEPRGEPRGDGRIARGGRGGRGRDTGRTGRPKVTADELDAEMDDYWGSSSGPMPAPATTGPAATVEASSTAARPVDEDVDMIE